ncbi:MAG: hypothetical protein ACSLEX_00450, partial [Minisyncoccota bacterium]
MENSHYNLSGFLEYQEGILCVDGVPYSEILLDQYSPTVCVSLDRAKSNVRFLQAGLVSVDHSIHYAIKASYLKPLVMAIQKQGAGAEVISEYEWKLALKAGFSGKQIVMNGLGRTAEELMMAINSGAIVNIDSLSELKKLCLVADVFKGSHQNIWSWSVSLQGKFESFVLFNVGNDYYTIGISDTKLAANKEVSLNREHQRQKKECLEHSLNADVLYELDISK